MNNEAGQKHCEEKSRLIDHLSPHMAKRDAGDRSCQSIKRPRPDLERPERRYAALKTELGHSVIVSSTPLPETPFRRTSCTAHRKVVTPRRFHSTAEAASGLRSRNGQYIQAKAIEQTSFGNRS